MENDYQSYRDELLASAVFQRHIKEHYAAVKSFVRDRRLFSDSPLLLGIGLGIAFSFSCLFAGSAMVWAKILGGAGIIGCMVISFYGSLYLEHEAEDSAAEKIFRHLCYETVIKEYICSIERNKTIALLRDSRNAEDTNDLKDNLDSLLDELYEYYGEKLPHDYKVRETVRTLLKLKDL